MESFNKYHKFSKYDATFHNYIIFVLFIRMYLYFNSNSNSQAYGKHLLNKRTKISFIEQHYPVGGKGATVEHYGNELLAASIESMTIQFLIIMYSLLQSVYIYKYESLFSLFSKGK